MKMVLDCILGLILMSFVFRALYEYEIRPMIEEHGPREVIKMAASGLLGAVILYVMLVLTIVCAPCNPM